MTMGVHQLVSPLAHHSSRNTGTDATIITDHQISGRPTVKRRLKTFTVAWQLHLTATDAHQRRQQIDEGYTFAHTTWRVPRRRRHREGHTRGPLKKTLLEPHTTLAQHFTMVCAENHHGVLGLTTGLQRLHQFSHLVVNKRDHCVIPLTGAALIVLCHPVPVPAMCKKQSTRGVI